MTILSMNQAAKMFRVSRNTLKSKLEQGVLSYSQSGTGIDLSELIRVFGAAPEHALIEQGRARRSNPVEQGRATPEQAEIGENRAKIAALEVEVRLLRERIEDKEKHLDDVRQALRLLEDKSEKKKRWKWW